MEFPIDQINRHCCRITWKKKWQSSLHTGDIRSHFRFRFLFLRCRIKLPIVHNCGWATISRAEKKIPSSSPSCWPGPSGQTMTTKEHYKIQKKIFKLRAISLVIAPASSGEYGSSHVHSEYKADEKPCHENHIHRTQLDWIKPITIFTWQEKL